LVVALLPQKAAGKARVAGLADCKVKTRNAAGRLLGRNPEGTRPFSRSAALIVAQVRRVHFAPLALRCTKIAIVAAIKVGVNRP
jgi:hypothetical protein